MRVSVCVGNYAREPYCIPGLEVNVFSMEELCYCIRENAFLLDLSFMNDGLLDWIEDECGLRELAKALHPLVHKQGSLRSFVMTILRFVGFWEEDALGEIEQALKQGAGLSGMEKRKSQIDYLVRQKKYRQALREYDELLLVCQGGEEPRAAENGVAAADFLARIWHNKGVAYAGLMIYDNAAECFQRALELDDREDYCVDFLAAKRMELSEEEYVAFAAGHGEWYQRTLDLEKKLERTIGAWEQQPDYLLLYNRRALRSTDRRRFYEDDERLMQALKECYRRGM